VAQAKEGDSVKIHYTGRLDDGTVFDSSRERDPLEFTLGSGMVIPGFDDAVAGMKVGEEKTTSIPSDEAYGPHRDDLLISVPSDRLPEDLEPQVGQQLQMQTGDGQTFVAAVTRVGEEEVVLDANHPLAGQDLTFDIELVEIG
jgi:peptidylprolyl isomerase